MLTRAVVIRHVRGDHVINGASVVVLPRQPRMLAPPQLPAGVEHLVALVEVVRMNPEVGSEPMRVDAAGGDLPVCNPTQLLDPVARRWRGQSPAESPGLRESGGRRGRRPDGGSGQPCAVLLAMRGIEAG
jgi:hypothetical protein